MKKKKRRFKIRYVVLSLFAALLVTVMVFMHFGGFTTGDSADPKEFAAYAQPIENLSVSENARIIALGEATHGNIEFQQLKLEVFQNLVEKHGVRAFALEGDYGGCEQVNRYIHGGSGTVQEATAAIGFAIYRTDEIAKLISYMRQYNESTPDGDDIQFYGFDMQRCSYSIQFLVQECKKLNVDTAELEKLLSGEDWNSEFDTNQRRDVLNRIQTELDGKDNTEKASHYIEVLLQNCELHDTSNSDLRDKYMAENVIWISNQEQQRDHTSVFISGHNMHVGKLGYDNMGKLLDDELGDNYYVIGTDFYKTKCNLPNGSSGHRTNQVFYSYDPLAKAAMQAKLDICWLDFSYASKSPELSKWISDYHYMGSLGEGYAFWMRLLPPSYRKFQQPDEIYDSMIFVAEATPTVILNTQSD